MDLLTDPTALRAIKQGEAMFSTTHIIECDRHLIIQGDWLKKNKKNMINPREL